MSNQLLDIYHTLLDRFGPQHWWPGDTPLEVMVGAVLTQNTNWANVSRAIANLKSAGLLSVEALAGVPLEVLAQQILPAGYYNLKAGRLKNLLALVAEYPDGLDGLFQEDTPSLRERLLGVRGIGPETADSILLYAAGRPVFVVDAYTHRILTRHALIDEDSDYHAIQECFLDSLPEDASLFNEYHALLVRVGKEFCKKSKPFCPTCPLAGTEVI
jgi:endonuclease III related protein